MKKSILRVIIFLLCSSFSLAFAQEGEPSFPHKQTEEVPQQEEFFTPEQAPDTFKGAFTKMMLTLLGLILLIVVSVWVLRRISHNRMGQINHGREIKVLERRPLSAKSVLYLVEIAGKKVVIAESQLEVRPIVTADRLDIEELS